MTTTTTMTTTGPSTRRALVQPVATGLLVVVTFVGTYLLLLLSPAPHDLRVAVAAPPEFVAAITEKMPPAARHRVDLVAVPSASAAETAVRQRTAAGAYLPGERTVVVAAAAGAATAQALTDILAAVAGVPVEVRDVAPLPLTDPRGLGGFYLVFGMVLAAFIFGQTNHLYSRGLPLRLRLAQTAVISLAAGALGAVIAGPVVGATTASVAVVAEILILLVAAVALFTQAVTTVLGDAGILVATLLLLTLGNAASGGAIPVAFLPAGLREIAELLPPGAAVRALQDASAFPQADPRWPYFVLLCWVALGLLVLLAAYRGRSRAPALT